MKTSKLLMAGAVLAAGFGVTQTARADFSLVLDNWYHGDQPPTSSVATIDFIDVGPGKVKMIVTSSLPTDITGEYIQELAFNVSSAHAGAGVLSLFSGPTNLSGTFTLPTFNGANISEFQADFVLNFDFATASAGRFNYTDSFEVVFQSSSLSDVLDASDFDVQVPYKADNSVLLTAAVKIAGFDGSGEVGDGGGGDIPEPASLGVLGLGAAGLLLRRRK